MNMAANTTANSPLPTIKAPAPLAVAGVLDAAPDPDEVPLAPLEPVEDAPPEDGALAVLLPGAAPEGATVLFPGAGADTAGGTAVTEAAAEVATEAAEVAADVATEMAEETAEETADEAAALDADTTTDESVDAALDGMGMTALEPVAGAEEAGAGALVAGALVAGALVTDTATEDAAEGTEVPGAGAWGWPSEI